jgi:hypothetical protein
LPIAKSPTPTGELPTPRSFHDTPLRTHLRRGSNATGHGSSDIAASAARRHLTRKGRDPGTPNGFGTLVSK